MEICSSYRCAVTQHQRTAALFRAKCSPHCSVLLCKTDSQQAVFHCKYTYGDLVFIQVCSDPAPMHCNTVFGKRHSPLFSAALQNRLTAGSVSLQIHLWRFALRTDVQGRSTNALQHCFWQKAFPTAQCCSAKQTHSRQCFTANTPMEIWPSYRCAVTQHQRTAALFRAKCSPHCSVLLCKTGSQQAVCHCSYTYGDLLFIQMCSDPTPVHCMTVFGKRHSPLFSAAVQNRFTAGSLSLQLHLWRFALHTGVQ